MLLTRRASASARALAALLLTALVLSTPEAASPVRPPEPDSRPEVRALWVLRTSLTSPASITALVQSARDHGFNTLLVQVRGRGDAYYNDSIEPRGADLQRQPASFDPLATVVAAAHTAG